MKSEKIKTKSKKIKVQLLESGILPLLK